MVNLPRKRRACELRVGIWPSARWIGVIVAAAILGFAPFSSSIALARGSDGETPSVRRPVVTPRDFVSYTEIGDPGVLDARDGGGTKSAAVSPDGRWAAVVMRRGNPATEANEAELWLYDLATVMRQSTPTVLARFSSSSNNQPLALVRWMPDSRKILFAGASGNDPAQIYSVDRATGELRQLTRDTQPLLNYQISANGTRLMTVRGGLPRYLDRDPACLASGCLVEGTPFQTETGATGESPAILVDDLSTGQRWQVPPPERTDQDVATCNQRNGGFTFGDLSPDGRYILRVCRVRNPPAWWREYRQSFLRPFSIAADEALLKMYLTRVDTGDVWAVSDVPVTSIYGGPMWIDADRNLLLLPWMLKPLDAVSPAEREERRTSVYAFVYDPDNRQSTEIARFPANAQSLRSAQWDASSQMLVLAPTRLPLLEMLGTDHRDELPKQYFRLEQGAWSEATTGPPERRFDHSVSLRVEEGLELPQQLVAIDDPSGRRRVLAQPNLWLRDRELGRVRIVRWTARNGREWSGILYYPADYRPGTRYPLVIQTHGYFADRFSLTGVGRNFAAQGLAGRGIAVIQVRENDVDLLNTPAEWPNDQAGYEACIDYLDREGIIDRTRVGIQGWSHTGVDILYTITRSDYRFSAAALTSSADVGWTYYMYIGAQQVLDAYYNNPPAPPFSEGLTGWLNNSAAFNMPRMNAPLLIWAEGYQQLADWNIGLKRLGHPVEQWYLPGGAHDVFKVGERILTGNLLIDWFDFWLNGHEDAAPAKSTQYVRWRVLREQQRRVLDSPRPPLVQWQTIPPPQ